MADIKANSLIKKILMQLDPGCAIISEEDDTFLNNRPDEYWLVDPIDGTSSWLNGFDGFVTQLAYIKKNTPIYGAVYAPCLKKLWTACKGEGAYLNGKILNKSKCHNSIKLIDNYPEPRKIAETIYKYMQITDYIESGSLGLKACLVADGTADLFIKDVVIKDWDIAPAEVILRELNMPITDLFSKNIKYKNQFDNNGIIVARDTILFNKVLHIIKSKKLNIPQT